MSRFFLFWYFGMKLVFLFFFIIKTPKKSSGQIDPPPLGRIRYPPGGLGLNEVTFKLNKEYLGTQYARLFL